MSETFLWACALVLVLEGLGPLLFPNRWRRYMAQLAKQPVETLRQIGGILVTVGLVILWLVQR